MTNEEILDKHEADQLHALARLLNRRGYGSEEKLVNQHMVLLCWYNEESVICRCDISTFDDTLFLQDGYPIYDSIGRQSLEEFICKSLEKHGWRLASSMELPTMGVVLRTTWLREVPHDARDHFPFLEEVGKYLDFTHPKGDESAQTQ